MTGNAFRSRPEYRRLAPAPEAHLHVAVAAGAGLAAIASAFTISMQGAARLVILYTPDGDAFDCGQSVAASMAVAPDVHKSRDELLACLNATLDAATMGTRVYVAGNESFISAASVVARACGVSADAIELEHCGSVARRVQCVHCKTRLEDVVASPVQCSCCGENLLVRDHYSSRLGAYMGVSIDADAPGTAPPPSPLAPVYVAEGEPSWV